MPKRLINIKVVTNVVGSLVMISGGLMSLSIPFSIYYKGSDLYPLILSTVITLLAGLGIKYSTRHHKNDEVKKREGYLIVALGWLSMTVFASLPYVLSGAIPNYTNAFFETISGLTTTGASILNDIESLPRGILFWNSTR